MQTSQLEGINFPRQNFINLLNYQIERNIDEVFHNSIRAVVIDNELITHDMVQRILSNLDKDQFKDEIQMLETSIAQGTLLNEPELRKSVYRLVEYASNKNLSELLSIGLFLRCNVAGEVRFKNNTVYNIPRYNGYKCGLSCSTDPKFDFLFEFIESKKLPYSVRDMRQKYGVEARAFLVYRLTQAHVIYSNDWHLEEDGANNDKSHVTVAPAREFYAEEPVNRLNKVRIPELEYLPWVLDGEEANPVLILKARADWRDDFLPDRDEWATLVIATMNKILQIGEVDDFVNVWRLHQMMTCNYVGVSLQDTKQDYDRVINFAVSTISSYIDSDIHDSHDPDMVALSALRFLQQLQTKVCTCR